MRHAFSSAKSGWVKERNGTWFWHGTPVKRYERTRKLFEVIVGVSMCVLMVLFILLIFI